LADPLLDDLLEWLRIPSISTGGGAPEDLRRAAAFVCERVEAAGGVAELVTGDGNPIAYGELRARDAGAPTVLIYGHYDVQSIGDPAAWLSDPFAPEIRDDRIYARGASDDKGNFLPLLHAACAQARAGELAVNVRVLVEGEEEAGGAAVAKWLAADERGADAAIVFDSDMADAQTPAITVGLRGMVMGEIAVRVGRRDLHSGMYGGSVLNAAHVLHAMLAEIVPGPDGVPRDELRAGAEPPAEAERESWARLRPGDEVIAEVGGRPVSPDAGARFYERNGADTSVEVNQIVVGEPRTIVPAAARATVSVRLAPGQSSTHIAAELERLLRGAVPAGAEVELDLRPSDPALFPVDSRPMQLAAQAIQAGTGMAPVFQRSGGSIPIVTDFAAKDITTIVSGFALPDDDIHAPNESYRLESLRLGERAAHELLRAFAAL
jgi:acetylornithine deacetylase/succinyl-diaminopimelate desuccinylase-like protein